MGQPRLCRELFGRTVLGALPPGGRVAVVGLGKNVGKTTTVNVLLDHARGMAVPCGVLTIGHDGEATDAITGLPKPPVRVGAGDVFATTPRLLAAVGDAAVEAARFAWGVGPDTVLAVARRDADVELAAPGTLARVETVVREAARLSGGWVLVDGAFGRRAAATTAVADRVVLSAGAAQDEDPGAAASEARAAAALFRCAPPPAAVTAALQNFGGRGPVMVADDGELAAVAGRLRLPSSREWYVFVPGAVTDRTLDAFGGPGPPGGLVVPAPGHLLMSPLAWDRWGRAGKRVHVVAGVAFSAVTVNPVCPGGWAFDPREFAAAVGAATGAAAFDLVAGVWFSPSGA